MSNPEAARARAQLRSLINQVDNQRAELTSTTSCGISNIIGQANNMYDVTSKDTRTSAVDASLIAKTAALGAEQAGNLEKTTPDAWVKMLAVAFGQGREGKRINWKRLGEGVVEARVFKESPGVVFLLGEWEGPAVKKTRERKQKARGPDEPLQTADTADVSQIQEEREDKAQVARIKLMETRVRELSAAAESAGGPRRVNLFRLLVHPTSFSQTVENFFDFAFLVKDGKVAVSTADDCAYVCDAEKPVTADYAAGLYKVQNILKLDYPIYRQLVARWCDGKPLVGCRGEATAIDPPAVSSSKKSRTH